MHGEWLVCDIYGLEIVPPFSVIADEVKIDREDRLPLPDQTPDLGDRLKNFSSKLQNFSTDGSNYWFGFQGDNNFHLNETNLADYFKNIWGDEDFSDWELASLWDLEKDGEWDGKVEFDKLFDNTLYNIDSNYDGDCSCNRDIANPYDHLDVFELIQDASDVDVDFFEDFIKPVFDSTGLVPRFNETYARVGGLRMLVSITLTTPSGNFLIIEPGDTVIRFKDELFVHTNEYRRGQ
jgi:hypothetical protein